ncbi:MAG: hypothetical protein PHN64_08055, partial [Desulfovibrionaceae bacterium]|nr:hypothetical protein [Desulfovibrionaceae bacterium]
EPLGFTAPPVPQRRRGKLCAFALLVKLKVFISSKTFSLFSLTACCAAFRFAKLEPSGNAACCQPEICTSVTKLD